MNRPISPPSMPRTRPAASLAWIALLALLALLSGCASLGTVRTFALESELRAARGEPTRIWTNPDGSRTFEYATQPNGDQCWMYTIGADGRIVEQHDALAPANLARVSTGMTIAEVERLLGQHLSIQRFVHSGEEVWDWNIVNEWPDLVATRFNVHFVDGKVVRTSRSHIYPRESWVFGIGIGGGRHPWWGLGWSWPIRPRPYPW